MYSIQRITDIRWPQLHLYLMLRGPKAQPCRKVVWRGTNAHKAFLQLYKTMAANT